MADDCTVGDLIPEFLSACGVTTVAGIASVHNIPMVDAIGRRNTIRFMMTRAEIDNARGSRRCAYGRWVWAGFARTGVVSRAGTFGDTVAGTRAIKGLTMVEGDRTAVGAFRPYFPFNQKPA